MAAACVTTGACATTGAATAVETGAAMVAARIPEGRMLLLGAVGGGLVEDLDFFHIRQCVELGGPFRVPQAQIYNWEGPSGATRAQM